MCVCVCVTEVGNSGGETTVVTHGLCTYTLYCVGMITRGRTRGAAAEEDGVGEQQLEQTQSGCSSV